MNVTSESILADVCIEAYPILAPRSLPPSEEPAVRMNMQATMLMISVRARTSHSWYIRVIRGFEASGISSAMEWKRSGKTVKVGRVVSDGLDAEKVRGHARWPVVSSIPPDVLCLLVKFLFPSLEISLSLAKLFHAGSIGGRLSIRHGGLWFRERVVEGIGVE